MSSSSGSPVAGSRSAAAAAQRWRTLLALALVLIAIVLVGYYAFYDVGGSHGTSGDSDAGAANPNAAPALSPTTVTP